MSQFIPPFPTPFLFGNHSVVFPSVIGVQYPCSQRFWLLVSSLCSAVVSVMGVRWTPAELDGVWQEVLMASASAPSPRLLHSPFWQWSSPDSRLSPCPWASPCGVFIDHLALSSVLRSLWFWWAGLCRCNSSSFFAVSVRAAPCNQPNAHSLLYPVSRGCLSQGRSALALLTFRAGSFFVVGTCPAYYRRLRSIFPLPMTPSHDNKKCFPILPNAPCGSKITSGLNALLWYLPGSAVVKTLYFQCRGHGFNPWLGT